MTEAAVETTPPQQQQQQQQPLLPPLPLPPPSPLLVPGCASTASSEVLPPDLDNEATVHDFLDYTEWLPSDIIRSLRLIHDQDQYYHRCTLELERLAIKYAEGRPNGATPNKIPRTAEDEKKYGCLGGESELAYAKLRVAMSRKLNEAIKAREEAKAEADRLYDNVDSQFNRLSSVLYRLQQIPLPDREPTPKPTGENQDGDAHMKITLRVDRSQAGSRRDAPGRGRRRGGLPSSRLGRKLEGQDDGWEDVPDGSPLKTSKRRGPGRRPNIGFQPKPLPPPPTTETGELIDPMDMPWNRLLPHELARLRKRMKKNTQWTPSSTMILRELESLGRGLANKEKYAHQLHDERYPHCEPEDGGIGNLGLEGEPSTENRGMKLNAAKRKLKAAQAAAAAAAAAAEQAKEATGTGESSVEEAVIVKKPITIHLKAPTTYAPLTISEKATHTELNPHIGESRVGSQTNSNASEPKLPATSRADIPNTFKETTPVAAEKAASPRIRTAAVPSPKPMSTTSVVSGHKRKRSSVSSPVRPSTAENGRSSKTTERSKESTPLALVPTTTTILASTHEALATPGPARRGRPPGKRKVPINAVKGLKNIKEGPTGADAGAETGRDRKQREGSTSDVYEEEEMEVNPHEPRYCVCNAHSYGIMVACDSKECPTEWFHLQCVGLAKTPAKNTKWFCPTCREDKDKSKNPPYNGRRRNSSVVQNLKAAEATGIMKVVPTMEEEEDDDGEELVNGSGRKKRKRKTR